MRMCCVGHEFNIENLLKLFKGIGYDTIECPDGNCTCLIINVDGDNSFAHAVKDYAHHLPKITLEQILENIMMFIKREPFVFLLGGILTPNYVKIGEVTLTKNQIQQIIEKWKSMENENK